MRGNLEVREWEWEQSLSQRELNMNEVYRDIQQEQVTSAILLD